MAAPKIFDWVTTVDEPKRLVRRDSDGEEIECVYDATRPAGQRWTWRRGDASGSEKTQSDAFYRAMQARPTRRRGGPSGPSGANTKRAWPLRATEEQHAAHEAAAAREGLNRTEWALRVLDEAARSIRADVG